MERPSNGYCGDCKMDWRLCIHGGGGMLAVTSECQRVYIEVYKDGKRFEATELGEYLGSVISRVMRLEGTRPCKRCGQRFEPVESVEARLVACGSYQKVCASCVLLAIDDMACESIMAMSDEEIEAELREDGVDVESFKGKVQNILRDALAKREP